MFYNSYREHPDNHYIYDKKYWTYKDVYQYINSVIVILKDENIEINDKVILYMENSIEYVIAYFAVLSMGATVVPIISTSTVESISEIIEDSQPKLMLTSLNTDFKIKNISFSEKVAALSLDIEKLDKVSSRNMQEIRTGHLAMIIYTSGTSNRSKGVMLTHENLLVNTDSILCYLQLKNTDSILAVLSFAYSYGNSILLTHTKAGALLYLYKAVYPQAILSLIKTGEFSGFSTVGSFLNVLLKQKNITLDSFSKLRYITLAGEQTAKENLIKLQGMSEHLKIYVMYGQTEASARLTYLEPDMLRQKMGSVGKPIKNVELKILDESGKEVESGIKGEIAVKGENVMEGYLNKPEETNEVLKDGWLWTGDIGYKDIDGYVFITGRKRDIIKYLGYRISPVEIENCINLNDNVLESGVIEYQCDASVKIAAAIVLNEKMLDIRILCKELKGKLPLYKIPKIFFVVEELPKTSNGKIKRQELQWKLTNCRKEDIHEYSI
jgi:acyl-CoA synthetase (AMP-forming)/AMP-acid ligase II